MRPSSLSRIAVAIAATNLLTLSGAELVTAGESAPGTQAAGGGQTTPQQRLLENKLKLLEKLIYDNPAVQRIEGSDNAEAKALLQTARAAHERAGSELALARLDKCESYLNEGLRAISDASRRVSAATSDASAAQTRYQELHARVQSFKEAFARVTTDKGSQVSGVLDDTRVQQLTDEAQRLSEERRYRDAADRLNEAAKLLEAALAEALHQKTLVYALKFNSPEEEYAYEVERNRSHMMLIKLLLARESLPTGSREYILSMVDQSEKRRLEAQSLAAHGETDKAIAMMEDATKSLVQALRSGGMAIP